MCSWLSRSCEIEEQSACISRALPLAPLGPSSPETRRWARAPSDIRGSQREMRRTCHSLSRGGNTKDRLHTSKALQCSLLPHPPAPQAMPYEKWLPLRAWPQLIQAVDPPHLIGMTPPFQYPDLLPNPAHLHAHSCVKNIPRSPFGVPGVYLD